MVRKAGLAPQRAVPLGTLGLPPLIRDTQPRI